MTLSAIYNLYEKSSGVTIDSRKVTKDTIFFGLKGNQVDGNQYAADALEKGAKAAIVDDPSVIPGDAKDYIHVDDVLKTMQDLASYHRDQISIPVIGITGSNGKTTTKELIRSVLAQSHRIYATEGNLNNHIGLPLSVLSIGRDFDLAILEFGANQHGEHEMLCRLAKPSHGIITNIGKDHLEGYGSFEGVIQAHQEFTNYIKSQNGILFTNMDDPNVQALAKGLLQVNYGNSNSHQRLNCGGVITKRFPALGIRVTNPLNEEPAFDIDTKLYGQYNFANVMAAVCIGQYFNVSLDDIQKGIQAYEPENNRSQIIKEDNKAIILDAYNANPSSMEMALKDFVELGSSCKVAILGDMFELGEYSKQEHQRIINQVNQAGLKGVFVGSQFANLKDDSNHLFFDEVDKAKQWFKNNDLTNCWILIKGSRGMEMETIIQD